LKGVQMEVAESADRVGAGVSAEMLSPEIANFIPTVG
jgi:hypothetical protein